MTDDQAVGPPSPYVGLEPFKTGQKLYGRDWEIRKLVDLLIARRIVLLHAPSGAGKTSLILAGLIPVLDEAGFRTSPPIQVSKLPSSEFHAKQESFNRYRLSTLLSLNESLSVDLRLPEAALSGMGLAAYLEARDEWFADPAGDEELLSDLLIFDQFEEILSMDPTDRDAKRAFFAELGAVLADFGRSALFAVRDDYVGGLEPYLRHLPHRLSTRFRLDLLEVRAAREPIWHPAKDAGVDFDEDAVTQVLEYLRPVHVQGVDGVQRVPGKYVEPAYLQVVCDSLWREQRPDHPNQITIDDVTRLTHEGDPLAAYYNRTVSEIARRDDDPEGDENLERHLRNWLEWELITEQGLRNQVLKGGEAKYKLGEDTITRLTRARLLRREERGERTWYELMHDCLVEAVRKANAAWREAHPGPLSAAVPWERASGPARDRLLLRGRVFQEARAWVREHEDELTSLEREYWKASEEAYKQAETRTRLGANLTETGWGVIFAADADPNVREALAELLEHRREQATLISEDYYREFAGAEGYRPAEEGQPAETAREFLKRHGVGYGPADPARMPYYLLIVGDPETIPFEFQYALDVQYAVGRIDFGDDLEAYASYARSVVLSESGKFRLPSRAVIFGPQHQGDEVTALSRRYLAEPLMERLRAARPGWTVQAVLGEQAEKARLAQLLGGIDTPALLFTVGHSFRSRKADERQADILGALLCANWHGRPARVDKEHFFSATDVPDDAKLVGLVAFLLGAMTAGTPRVDNFAFTHWGQPDEEIAPRAMLSRLPQHLLGHPWGGALAVIGHVDNLYVTSFQEGADASDLEGAGVSDLAAFEETLGRLMGGHTVGAAMESFNQRYSHFSSMLSEALQQATFYGRKLGEKEGAELDRKLRQMGLQTIDARNYIVLGDPAVRLPVPPVVDEGVDIVRPTIEPVPPVAPRRKAADITVAQPELAPSDLLVFNGIDGATGEYLFPGLSLAELAEAVKQAAADPDQFLERVRSSARF